MQGKDLNCYVISGLLEKYLFPDSKRKWFDRISYNSLLQSCYSIEANILLSYLRKWLRIIPLTRKRGDDWLEASALCVHTDMLSGAEFLLLVSLVPGRQPQVHLCFFS